MLMRSSLEVPLRPEPRPNQHTAPRGVRQCPSQIGEPVQHCVEAHLARELPEGVINVYPDPKCNYATAVALPALNPSTLNPKP